MKVEMSGKCFLICCFLVLVLVSQQAASSMTNSADIQTKNTYSPVLCHSPSRSQKKPPCDQDPSPSTGGSYGSNTPPPSHHGGYYNSPPSYGSSPPPSPVDPGTRTPSIPLVPPTPTTPPSPFIPDPNTPPLIIGPVIYWRTHPAAIWALFGYWGTIGHFFGVAATSAFGSNLTLQEALASTRRDGLGALCREGTAALLNSMVSKKYAYSSLQVRNAFTAALVSNNAAATQAELFKQANEAHFA
ncbi:hypothetical protein IHE45_20G053100 [Dioscorea alata]|uniref:Uncharacterized protein n=1 Tax=Dioscorea alata TaxID=55571 RepID=A0ACB7TTU9_DIOAL|nr:hypothetical protein IHE45_20G053100 [Dioscorea alata]